MSVPIVELPSTSAICDHPSRCRGQMTIWSAVPVAIALGTFVAIKSFQRSRHQSLPSRLTNMLGVSITVIGLADAIAITQQLTRSRPPMDKRPSPTREIASCFWTRLEIWSRGHAC